MAAIQRRPIESVLLHRPYTVSEFPPPLRPILGIQLAPPVVGYSAYLSITSGPPDLFAQALIDYGLFQVLLMIRLLPKDYPATLRPLLLRLHLRPIRPRHHRFRAVRMSARLPRLLPPPLQPPPETLHPPPGLYRMPGPAVALG